MFTSIRPENRDEIEENRLVSQKVLFNCKFLIYISFAYILIFCSQSWAQEAAGEKLWEVHPSFSVSEQYNDNVRREAYDAREEDFNVQWRPGLELKYNGDWQQHTLAYFSLFKRYHHLFDEDTNTHHADLLDSLTLGKRILFTVRTTDKFRSERRDLRLAERRDNFLETNIFSVNPTLRLNLLENTSLEGFYDYSRTSIMEKDKEDYLSNTFGGSLIQRFLDKFEVLGGYRRREQEFLKDTPDFVDNNYFGGLNWDITSTLRFEGEYGKNIRKYDRETDLITDATTEADVWKATLRNDVTETTYVDISYSQSQEVREVAGTEQIIAEVLKANFRQIYEKLLVINLTGSYRKEDFEFSDRRDFTSDVNLLLSTNFSEIIIFQLGGGYANNYFWPIAVRENIYDYRAGIIYHPLEWLTGMVEYRHVENDNNASEESATLVEPEFIQNIITFTITARF